MKKIIIIFIIFLLVSLGYYLTFVLKTPCLFNELTGLYCPACGTTRMISSLVNLEIYQAFRYNPLMFILAIVFFVYIIMCIFKGKLIKVPKKYLYALVVIIILFWILRNIDYFSFLQPTYIIKQ